MKRIFLRAGKIPEKVLSPEETLATNAIGNNTGNFLFSHSAHRMLSGPDTEVVAGGLWLDPKNAERINSDFDHVVLPLANAFRPGSSLRQLNMITDLIEQLKVPVTILSVGLQASVDMSKDELAPLNESVTRFVKAVLKHSPTLGVRGEFTAEYIQSLGFSEVEVIGCPSTFMFGDKLHVEKKLPVIDESSKVSFTVSAENKNFNKTIAHHMSRYANLSYIAQDLRAFQVMLEGGPMNIPRKNKELPLYPAHPLFVNDQARLFVDVTTWLDYLSKRDFMFGDRIHGTIAALLAGTPGYLVAHDSRTLELARYHKIPHTMLSNKDEVVDARELYAEADYTQLNNGQAERFNTFEKYLKKNNLAHSLNNESFLEAYDKKLTDTKFPPAVKPITAKGGLAKMYYNARYERVK